jgi:hypothetical protein
MIPQEDNFEQQVIDIATAYIAAFPNIALPSAEWQSHWLNKYSSESILSAIKTLASHPPSVKARFNKDSVGRAISSLLRADAVRRAIAIASVMPGGRS